MNKNYRTPKKPTHENVGAVIVSYWPGIGFAERVERLSKIVDRILVVDNTSDTSKEIILLCQLKIDNVEVKLNSSNEGIAAAMNNGVNWSINRRYEWTLTLDQDTILESGFLDEIGATYESIPSKESIALIGCNYKDSRGLTGRHWNYAQDNDYFIDSPVIISSGSFINNTAFVACGPFREDYFIDYVDNEYCLRVRGKGYRTYITKKTITIHSIGNRTYSSFFSHLFYTSNHMAFRRYFIAKNRTLTVKKYWKSNLLWCSHQLIVVAIEFIKIIILESNRKMKLKALIDGYFDAISGNNRNPQDVIREYSDS